MTWHSTNASLPSAKVGTRQIKFFLFFSPHFFWGLAIVIKTPSQNLGQFWVFLLYFLNYFCFVEFFRLFQIWTACTWNNGIWSFKKMVFMMFGVCWGRIQELAWNYEHLVVVTWRCTCGKSVFKLYKIQTKSKNHETCRGVLLSHVEAVVKN